MQKSVVLEIKIALYNSLKNYQVKCCAVELLEKTWVGSSPTLFHRPSFSGRQTENLEAHCPSSEDQEQVTNPESVLAALKSHHLNPLSWRSDIEMLASRAQGVTNMKYMKESVATHYSKATCVLKECHGCS